MRRLAPLLAVFVLLGWHCGVPHSPPPTTSTTTTSTTTTTTLPPTTTTQPSNVYPVPPSIVSDCSADIGNALNEWLSIVPNGATAQLAVNGCYLSEQSLLLNDRVDFTFDGRGSTLRSVTTGENAVPPPEHPLVWNVTFLWPRLRAHVWLRGGENITVRNVHVDGPNEGPNSEGYFCAYHGQKWEEQNGFSVYASHHVLIEDVTVKEVHGDAVSINSDASHVTVQDSAGDCIGRQGMSVTFATDILLQRNTLDRVGRSVFDLESAVAFWPIRRVTIRNNTVGLYGGSEGDGVFFANRGDGNAPHSDIIVTDNVSTWGPAGAVVTRSAEATNYVFTGNVGAGVAQSGCGTCGLMRFEGVQGLTVAGNSQTIFTRYPEDGAVYSGIAVSATGSIDITVRDNVFTRHYGLLVDRQTWPLTVLYDAAPGEVTLLCGNYTPDDGAPLGEPVDGPCP